MIVIVPVNLRPAGAPLSGLLDQLGYQQADVLGMSGGGDGPGRSPRSAGGRTRGRTGCRAPRAQQRRQRGQMVKDHRRRRAADARHVEPDNFVLRAERVDEWLQRPTPQINVKLLHHPLTNVPLCQCVVTLRKGVWADVRPAAGGRWSSGRGWPVPGGPGQRPGRGVEDRPSAAWAPGGPHAAAPPCADTGLAAPAVSFGGSVRPFGPVLPGPAVLICNRRVMSSPTDGGGPVIMQIGRRYKE